MEGAGRIASAIAQAAGRPAGAAALTSASSAPALRVAAREWRELVGRTHAAQREAWHEHPPADWCEAADRLLR
eukprot:3121504-Pleurochrysis_carterae.AAC.1